MARAVAKPSVVGETLNPPKYGQAWSEVRLEKSYSAYSDYEERRHLANAEGGVTAQE